MLKCFAMYSIKVFPVEINNSKIRIVQETIYLCEQNSQVCAKN